MSVNKEVIQTIRTNFLTQVQQNIDKYEHGDVQRVTDNDWWIERFVLVTKNEDDALRALIKAMEWRKSFGVNDLSQDYFPQEVYKIGVYNINFKDKEGRPIVWVRMCRHHKSELSPLIKKYMVYLYETLDKQTSHQGWATIADMTGAGLSNVDSDLRGFMTEVLQNYYPRGIKYQAVVDLPWILSATGKLMMSFMNEELKNSVKFLTSDDLHQYLDQEYIPVHLKGTYDKDMVCIPEGVKTLEELTHTQFSVDQIKKIRAAFKSELD